MIPEDIRKQIPTDPEAFNRWLEENYKEVTVPTKLELSGVRIGNQAGSTKNFCGTYET